MRLKGASHLQHCTQRPGCAARNEEYSMHSQACLLCVCMCVCVRVRRVQQAHSVWMVSSRLESLLSPSSGFLTTLCNSPNSSLLSPPPHPNLKLRPLMPRFVSQVPLLAAILLSCVHVTREKIDVCQVSIQRYNGNGRHASNVF